MDINGYPWTAMDIHGWISMDVHGCLWISMDVMGIYGYRWISMGIHGYPWMGQMSPTGFGYGYIANLGFHHIAKPRSPSTIKLLGHFSRTMLHCWHLRCPPAQIHEGGPHPIQGHLGRPNGHNRAALIIHQSALQNTALLDRRSDAMLLPS